MQSIEKSEIDLIEAEECAAQILLAMQMSTKSKTDCVKHELFYQHPDFGHGHISVVLKSGSNFTAAGKKEIMEIFSIDWETANEFKIHLLKSRIVNRRSIRH